MKNILNSQLFKIKHSIASKTTPFAFTGGAIASLRLFTFLLFFSMLNLWTANSSAQSLSCPSPAGAPGGVPFSTNWSNNLATGQKIIPVVVHLIGNLPCADSIFLKRTTTNSLYQVVKTLL